MRDELERAKSQLDDANARAEHLLGDVTALKTDLAKYGTVPPFVPNGHFYSPVPSVPEAVEASHGVFRNVGREVAGVDMREAAQIELMEQFVAYHADLPFPANKTEGLRYFYENSAFSYGDSIFLNGVMRWAKPKRIIEIGSGYSSCMVLDTNERWFGNSIECTFIEPYADLLKSLIRPDDLDRVSIIEKRVQDVDTSLYLSLEADDILFVDSTHVSKIGSDVNHIIFNVLPTLKPGVLVHFHDIFFPFEYPHQWISMGIAWNEAYILRAFLMNNNAFEVVVHNNFLWTFHKDRIKETLPLVAKNAGAGIWIRKK